MHVTFWEKVGCGLLVCGWLLWGGMMLAGTLVHPNTAGVDKLMFAKAETKQEAAGKPAKPEITDVKVVLAKADAKNGAKVFKKCVSCHSDDKGGKNKVGPNLWDVVDRQPGVHGGFAYSDAMKAVKTPWTYQHLFDFVHDPRKVVPGTKMTFAGISDAQDRGDLIAYLRTQSDSPKPLP